MRNITNISGELVRDPAFSEGVCEHLRTAVEDYGEPADLVVVVVPAGRAGQVRRELEHRVLEAALA